MMILSRGRFLLFHHTSNGRCSGDLHQRVGRYFNIVVGVKGNGSLWRLRSDAEEVQGS